MPEAITSFDFNIVLWIQECIRSPLLSAVLIPITVLGNSGFIFILIGALMMFFKKTRSGGILLLTSLAAAFVLNDLVIKNIVQRPRPFADFTQIIPLVPPPGKYSFPSGHTAAAFSSMVTLFFSQRKYAPIGLVFAVIMGLSRIYAGVHYPTDVLGGAILGTAVAVVGGIIYRKKLIKTEFRER